MARPTNKATLTWLPTSSLRAPRWTAAGNATTLSLWGGGAAEGAAINRDIPGFCKSATLDEIRQNSYVLIPGRSVGGA